MKYQAEQFIDGIKTRSWLGMLHGVDGALVGIASAKARSSREAIRDLEFTRFLAGVRDYLLSEGRLRPRQLDDQQFVLLKPLCEHLVETGRIPRKRLDLFGEANRWPVVPTSETKSRNPFAR